MEILKAYLWRFWHNLLFKTETIGNVRRETNRFTGDFRLYKIHPLARMGVNFSAKQQKIIEQLFRDDMIPEAQTLILKEIEETIPDAAGLGEAFLEYARQMENKQNGT